MTDVSQGKTVRIFLVEGHPNGILTAEIMNWTGRITSAPRLSLEKLAHRDELKRTGIYVLSNVDDYEEPTIYIGESDNVWERLKTHNQEKDFWNRVLIVTSKDDNLTKAHARFLESKLIQIANETRRARLRNGTAPDVVGLPESDQSDMTEFLSHVQLLLPILGLDFAIPRPVESMRSPVFEMIFKGATAHAQEIENEFVVLRGSEAQKAETPSITDSAKRLRESLLQQKHLVEIGENLVFQEDIPFTSPSAASDVVGGASLNGRVYWKIQDTKQTYADWKDQQISMAEKSDV